MSVFEFQLGYFCRKKDLEAKNDSLVAWILTSRIQSVNEFRLCCLNSQLYCYMTRFGGTVPGKYLKVCIAALSFFGFCMVTSPNSLQIFG